MRVRVVAFIVLIFAVSFAVQPHETEDVIKSLTFSWFLFLSSIIVLCKATACGFLLILSLPFSLFTPPENYNGKVFLILGASSGIGKDLALQAAQRGATLVLAARRLEKLKVVSEDCVKLGAKRVDILKVDVSVPEETQMAIDKTTEWHNRLDVLLLNAAIPGPWSHIEDIKNTSSLHELMDINYWGYVIPTIQAIPILKKSQGDIIVVSSMYAHIIAPFQAGYCASKHALHGFYDVIRQELKSYGVGVTVHCPGGIATEVLSNFQTADSSKVEFHIPDYFLGDSGNCAEHILYSYDKQLDEAFYPSYAGLFAAVRSVIPSTFDNGYHWITNFYVNLGFFHWKSS